MMRSRRFAGSGNRFMLFDQWEKDGKFVPRVRLVSSKHQEPKAQYVLDSRHSTAPSSAARICDSFRQLERRER